MLFGTVTHFEQGWPLAWYEAAVDAGASTFRDGVSWAKVERATGVYDFSDPSLNWLRTLNADDADITLLFGRLSNPLYDSNGTVHTEDGIEAFAQYVLATVKAFPGISRIEIGNEFNGGNFVSGPVKSAGYEQRDEAYAAIISEVDRVLDEAGVDVDILGGAAHSIAPGWFGNLEAHGSLAHMDGIALHPYTTPPERFEDEIAVLRSVVGDEMPIYVTEFGQHFASAEEAPAYLAKMVSVMAASGITEADWYAFAEQRWFPNMGLYNGSTGTLTPAGEAFAFIQQILDDGPVSKVEVDDFTYVYSFGSKAAVVWGEPRSLSLADGVVAYDSSGKRIENFDGTISPEEPIVLISGAPLVMGQSYTFGEQRTVGHSYHQFDVTNPTVKSAAGFEGDWSYFSISGTGTMTALQTFEGGAKRGDLWTPFLASPWLRPLRADADHVNPADFAGGTNPEHSYGVLERFTSDSDRVVTISGRFDVQDSSTDGVRLIVRHNGEAIATKIIYNVDNGHVYDLKLTDIALTAGDTLDFIIDPNKSSKGGDLTTRTISIVEQEGSTAPKPDPQPEPEPEPEPQPEETGGSAELPVTGGLVLQLDAANTTVDTAGVVTGWTDESGRGNHLFGKGDPALLKGATPTGAAAVAFDGTGDLLQRIGSVDALNGLPDGAEDRTMFFVVRYNHHESVSSGLAYGDGAGNQAFGLVADYSGGDLGVQGWGGRNDFSTAIDAVGEGWMVQSVVLDDDVLEHFLDGAMIDSDTHRFKTDVQKLVIGGEIAGLGEAQMDVAAALMYDRALTDAERMSVETYLQQTFVDAGFSFG